MLNRHDDEENIKTKHILNNIVALASILCHYLTIYISILLIEHILCICYQMCHSYFALKVPYIIVLDTL